MLRLLVGRADLPRGLDPVQNRHRDVHQDDVRLQVLREPHGLPAVAGVPDDRDPVVAVEDRLERLGEEAVVVGYQHANVSHGLAHKVPC